MGFKHRPRREVGYWVWAQKQVPGLCWIEVSCFLLSCWPKEHRGSGWSGSIQVRGLKATWVWVWLNPSLHASLVCSMNKFWFILGVNNEIAGGKSCVWCSRISYKLCYWFKNFVLLSGWRAGGGRGEALGSFPGRSFLWAWSLEVGLDPHPSHDIVEGPVLVSTMV